MNKDLIFILLLSTVVLCLWFNNTTENMADDLDAKIKKAVSDVYLVDVESIRNLTEVAKKLQDGGLTIPSKLTTRDLVVIDGPNGKLELGPQNKEFAHIYTDRPQFAINKNFNMNGQQLINAANVQTKTLTSEQLTSKVLNSDILNTKDLNTDKLSSKMISGNVLNMSDINAPQVPVAWGGWNKNSGQLSTYNVRNIEKINESRLRIYFNNPLPNTTYCVMPFVNNFTDTVNASGWTGHYATVNLIVKTREYFDVGYYHANTGGREIGEFYFNVFARA